MSLFRIVTYRMLERPEDKTDEDRSRYVPEACMRVRPQEFITPYDEAVIVHPDDSVALAVNGPIADAFLDRIDRHVETHGADRGSLALLERDMRVACATADADDPERGSEPERRRLAFVLRSGLTKRLNEQHERRWRESLAGLARIASSAGSSGLTVGGGFLTAYGRRLQTGEANSDYAGGVSFMVFGVPAATLFGVVSLAELRLSGRAFFRAYDAQRRIHVIQALQRCLPRTPVYDVPPRVQFPMRTAVLSIQRPGSPASAAGASGEGSSSNA